MEASSRMQRFVTTRLPTRWLYALCHAAIPLYYLYRIPLFYPLRLLTKVAMDPDPEWRGGHPVSLSFFPPHWEKTTPPPRPGLWGGGGRGNVVRPPTQPH